MVGLVSCIFSVLVSRGRWRTCALIAQSGGRSSRCCGLALSYARDRTKKHVSLNNNYFRVLLGLKRFQANTEDHVVHKVPKRRRRADLLWIWTHIVGKTRKDYCNIKCTCCCLSISLPSPIFLGIGRDGFSTLPSLLFIYLFKRCYFSAFVLYPSIHKVQWIFVVKCRRP